MLQLIEENSITDPTYVEDFLLTHRTFMQSSTTELTSQLLQWFDSETTAPLPTAATANEIRDRVTRVVLLWVNNHFTDFESDPAMMEFLEIFEAGLERKNMPEHLRLLHIACAAKARQRCVTLARSARDEDLQFSIGGGYPNGYGIFITNVEKRSKPERKGLKRGDQILEVNGQSFEHVSNTKALELLMGTTHLSVTVRSNLLTFKEMLSSANSSGCAGGRRKEIASKAAVTHHTRLSGVDIFSAGNLVIGGSGGGIDQTDCSAKYLIKKDVVGGSGGGGGKSSATSNSSSGGFMTLGPKRRFQKALIKMNLLPKNAVALMMDSLAASSSTAASTTNSSSSLPSASSSTITASTAEAAVAIASGASSPPGTISAFDDSETVTTTTDPASGRTSSISMTSTTSSKASSSLYQSHSNPDLTSFFEDHSRLAAATAVVCDYPEHVLKVYKPDQTCKYLLVHKETTAHEVVMLALQEFGIHETSSNFSLCEVSVAAEGGMIKQRRLPEQLQNLAERIALAARYYLKTNGVSETLVPDEMAPELQREATVHFLQLNANELAIQLTVQDFATFRLIEPTEYVDDLFELNSKYGCPQLRQFAELVNREMFWVVTEVCTEPNVVRRAKIIKQFVKIARHCKECKNFNSMFAIVSGLGHAAVCRLRSTWERLPSKYQKLFSDLQDLMDPSRNMSKYRQLVLAELLQPHPTIIPFYPVVKKDLTFIHLGEWLKYIILAYFLFFNWGDVNRSNNYG